LIPLNLKGQVDLCSQSFNPTIILDNPNGDFINISTLPKTILGNQTILILDNLVINQNTLLFQCNVRVAPGRKIIVKSNVTLSLANSTLYSCINRWQGIEMESTASKIVTQNSRIEDANIALYCYQHSIVELTTTVFDGNYVGIANKTGEDFYLNKFTGNSFTSNGTILPRLNPPTSPLEDNKCFAGILLNKTSLNVGVANNNGSSINLFNGLRHGIRAIESFVTVTNCKFANMVNSNVNPALKGIGILGISSNVKHIGWPGVNQFENNNFGIQAISSQLDVKNTNLKDNFAFAISSHSNKNGQKVSITNNVIQHLVSNEKKQAGIYLERSGGNDAQTYNVISNNNILVYNNIIDPVTNVVPYGIWINGSNNATNYLNVSNNTVTLQEDQGTQNRQYEGIHIDYFGMDYASVINNSITTAPGGYSHFGISCWASSLNASSNMVYNNTIIASYFDPNNPQLGSGYEATGTLKCGIHLDNCSGINFCNNDIGRCTHCFHSSGANTGTDLKTTKSGESWFGMFFDNTMFPNQPCKANTFIDDIAQYSLAARRKGSNDIFFTIKTNTPIENPPSANPLRTSWFFPNQTCNAGEGLSCTVFTKQGLMPPVFNPLDTSIARGNFGGVTSILAR